MRKCVAWERGNITRVVPANEGYDQQFNALVSAPKKLEEIIGKNS